MERKELLVYDMSGNFADKSEPCYKKQEADKVMDAMEARIKELESREDSLNSACRCLNNRIKELEDKVAHSNDNVDAMLDIADKAHTECGNLEYEKGVSDRHIKYLNNRIKELEYQLSDKGRKNSELFATNAELRNRIKELEDKINVLEKQSEVTDRMLQDMANNSNKEFLPDSNKELGTDHFVDANKMMWVSVKDRLPETNLEVLIWIDGIGVQQADFYVEDKGFYVEDYKHPSYWMPLPKPPTAEDSSDAAVVINNQGGEK